MENAKNNTGTGSRTRKPEISRWNVLLILSVLKSGSDGEHPLSAAEIRNKVNEEFAYLLTADGGSVMSVDTVKRTLDALVSGLFDRYGTISGGFGFRVGCLRAEGDGYEAFPFDGAADANVKKYYYYESEFTDSEVKTLMDAVETHNYFSDEDVCSINEKLSHLRPFLYEGKKYHDSEGAAREGDSLLLMNIDTLHGIIKRKNYAQIEYCAYNFKKELEIRPGYPKKVLPVKLMWSNGFYYMLAYPEKYDNIVNFRVDRIRGIEEVENTDRRKWNDIDPNALNPVQYRMRHPIMYAGESRRFELLCRDTPKRCIVNTLMDEFGKNMRIAKADDALLLRELGQDSRYFAEGKEPVTWLKVTLDATDAGMEIVATEYCGDILILSPEKSRKKVIDKLETALGYYGMRR